MRPEWTATWILHGLGDAVRAQERGADGGGNGTCTRWGAASVAVAFRRRGGLVERDSLVQSTRDGAAGNRAPSADRGMDHRRYGFPSRAALGRGGATILRPTSASRTIVRSQCRCRSLIIMRAAGGLSATFAERLGEGSRPSAQGGCAQGDQLQNQATNCA